MTRTHHRERLVTLLALVATACIAGLLVPVPGDPGVLRDTPVRDSNTTVQLVAPSSTLPYYGRGSIPLAFTNATPFTAAWFNIDGGTNVSIAGNTTVDLRNQTLGVREDGARVLYLFVQLANGTIVNQQAPFTVYSFRLFVIPVDTRNRVHGLASSLGRYHVNGVDTLVYHLNEFEQSFTLHPDATNVTFNVNHVSSSHRLQVTGYNATENYTFWSNALVVNNGGFRNATGTKLAFTITPNMPARLTTGAVASFNITMRNTGTVPLHRVIMHVGAVNLATGKVINQSLGGSDLAPGAGMQVLFSWVLSRDYDHVVLLFNVTADEYCEENVMARYVPGGGGLEAFLAFFFPWGMVLVGAVLVAGLVAAYYKKRLQAIRQVDTDGARAKELDQARRFMQQRRETDKFLEKQKPRLDFETETDFYGREVPRARPVEPWPGEKTGGKLAGKDAPVQGKDASMAQVNSVEPAPAPRSEPDETDITVDVQRDKCIVHGGPIKGASYICPSCGAKYCMTCASTLRDRTEGCWQCKTTMDI